MADVPNTKNPDAPDAPDAPAQAGPHIHVPDEIVTLADEMGHAKAAVLMQMQRLKEVMQQLDRYKADYAKLTTKKDRLLTKAAADDAHQLCYAIWFDERVEQTSRFSMATAMGRSVPAATKATAPATTKQVAQPVNLPTPAKFEPVKPSWPTWPAWDGEKMQPPVSRQISAELFTRYAATYSAHRLFSGDGVVGTFDYDSGTYVCTAITRGGTNSARPDDLTAWELVPIVAYEKGGGVVTKIGDGSYEGNVTRYRDQAFVMTRPVTFVLASSEGEPEPEPEPDSEGLDDGHVIDQEALAAVEEDNRQW